MSGTRRTSRMASLIRSELARVLIEEVSDPSLREVVITEVELSRDLKNARVYFAPLSGRDRTNLKEVDRGLHRALPFLKRKLGDCRLALRARPISLKHLSWLETATVLLVRHFYIR